MAKIVFVCGNCGTKYVNDTICGNCGQENKGDFVYEAIVSPGMPNARPAMPAETAWFDRITSASRPAKAAKGGK